MAWSGLAPDIDVVAYLAALVWYGFDKDRAFENVWRVVHHRYTHGILFVVLTGVVVWGLCRAQGPADRLRIVLLAMLAGALHNFFDVVAGGPTWPIYPLWPVSDATWHAAWSWTIGEWPNIVILAVCLAGTLAYAGAVGRSPMECFGSRTDNWLVRVLREGSDRPAGEEAPASARRRQRLRAAIWIALVLAAVGILAPLGFNPFA